MNGWAVFSGRVMLPYTVRLTRKEAIDAITDELGATWDAAGVRGYSVRKVEVREVGSEGPAPVAAESLADVLRRLARLETQMRAVAASGSPGDGLPVEPDPV